MAGRVLSSFAGNARKNNGLDAPATTFCPPRATTAGAGRSRGRIRGAAPDFREALMDLVAERTRALKAAFTRFCGTSCPAG
jgi:hypothetical protein